MSSPSAAEECFTKNDIIFANRPKLLAGKHLGYNYTTLIWALYGDHWRNLRRIASPEILSTNSLQMFYQIRVDEVRSLLRRLSKDSEDGKFLTVDFKSTLFELTLDVIMRMISGKHYCGENLSELDENKKFKDVVTETFELSGATNIGDFVPILKWFGLTKIEKRLAALQTKGDKFMQDLIEEHKRVKSLKSASEEGSHETMIDVLLHLQESEPEYYTDEIIMGLMQVSSPCSLGRPRS